jgi:hypothetical protein
VSSRYLCYQAQVIVSISKVLLILCDGLSLIRPARSILALIAYKWCVLLIILSSSSYYGTSCNFHVIWRNFGTTTVNYIYYQFSNEQHRQYQPHPFRRRQDIKRGSSSGPGRGCGGAAAKNKRNASKHHDAFLTEILYAPLQHPAD